MSAQKLSDRCRELGVPIERSVLAGLENQRRTKISLAEILVLAAALNVAPIILIFPVGDVETVEVLPDQTASPFAAAQWFSGTNFDLLDFQYGARDHWAWVDSAEKLNAYRRHNNLVNDMYDLWMQLNPSPQRRSLPNYREQSPEQLAARTRVLEDYGALLRERRDDMRAKGMLLPPVPEELQAHLSGPNLFRVSERGLDQSGTAGNDEGDRGVKF